MTGYIREWVAEHGEEEGIKDKGFAQAYLSWSHENTPTCNLITSNTCTQPSSNAKYENYQQFYTLWNIFAVYQYWNQYYSALTDSEARATAKLQKIVDMVAPPVEKALSVPEWYTIFGMGLYWATTIISPLTTLSGASAVPAAGISLILNGVWSARAVMPQGYPKAKEPTQTAQSRFGSLADVGSKLADMVEDWQKQTVTDVRSMQDNVDAFIALCEPGGFSQRVTLSLPDQSTALYKGLELFILAAGMTANGVVVAKSTGINPKEVATRTGEIQCPDFGPSGSCNNWWYDPKSGNSYAFHDTTNHKRDFTELVNWLWDEKIVENLGEIFENEACSGKEPSLDSPDLNVLCPFNAKNCEYNYDRHVKDQRAKQWMNCDNDPFWMKPCHDHDEEVAVLPLSYLGPLLHKDNYCRQSD
ncbi:hypothetical protein Tdes44962_MAKER06899 [Teratosphaeria destructans]|uniref:Uncharacterized protein n=1 Tax=Teratosphaeria destructans TaxID=418781 RepID=A0A9W7T055_9PEZI|nr:hypothetical protein Tdes44962_MAKER06899 [Teratosphaeria destructans]